MRYFNRKNMSGWEKFFFGKYRKYCNNFPAEINIASNHSKRTFRAIGSSKHLNTWGLHFDLISARSEYDTNCNLKHTHEMRTYEYDTPKSREMCKYKYSIL